MSTQGSATRRASGMKSARVNFGGRPNSLSTSAKPEIEVMWLRSVYPSGFALAATWAPTAPAAPALVSMTTGCLTVASITAASGLVTTSVTPPGGKALMIVMAWEGYASCACSGGMARAEAEAAKPAAKRRLSMDSLPRFLPRFPARRAHFLGTACAARARWSQRLLSISTNADEAKENGWAKEEGSID